MDFFSLCVVLVLSSFLGYVLIWRVTPSLHAPLMSLTNAISSIIVVSAMVFLSQTDFLPQVQADLATNTQNASIFFLASLGLFCCIINIAGGFSITVRMLSLFRNKKTPSLKKKEAP